jgi:hypothetical protein
LLKDPDYTMEFHRGELFQEKLSASDAESLAPLRHAPVVLDARLDAVLRALEEAGQL